MGHTIINKRVKCPTCGHEHILRRTGAYRDKPQKFIRCSQCKTVWRDDFPKAESKQEKEPHKVEITPVKKMKEKEEKQESKKTFWDKIF